MKKLISTALATLAAAAGVVIYQADKPAEVEAKAEAVLGVNIVKGRKAIAKYFNKAGQAVSPRQWQAEVRAGMIAQTNILVNGQEISITARFSGLPGQRYELGIDGSPMNAKHEGLHGRHIKYQTKAEAQAGYNQAVKEADKKAAEAVIIPR